MSRSAGRLDRTMNLVHVSRKGFDLLLVLFLFHEREESEYRDNFPAEDHRHCRSYHSVLLTERSPCRGRERDRDRKEVKFRSGSRKYQRTRLSSRSGGPLYPVRGASTRMRNRTKHASRNK